jgi:hypothetical protein
MVIKIIIRYSMYTGMYGICYLNKKRSGKKAQRKYFRPATVGGRHALPLACSLVAKVKDNQILERLLGDLIYCTPYLGHGVLKGRSPGCTRLHGQ